MRSWWFPKSPHFREAEVQVWHILRKSRVYLQLSFPCQWQLTHISSSHKDRKKNSLEKICPSSWFHLIRLGSAPPGLRRPASFTNNISPVYGSRSHPRNAACSSNWRRNSESFRKIRASVAALTAAAPLPRPLLINRMETDSVAGRCALHKGDKTRRRLELFFNASSSGRMRTHIGAVLSWKWLWLWALSCVVCCWSRFRWQFVGGGCICNDARGISNAYQHSNRF